MKKSTQKKALYVLKLLSDHFGEGSEIRQKDIIKLCKDNSITLSLNWIWSSDFYKSEKRGVYVIKTQLPEELTVAKVKKDAYSVSQLLEILKS